MGEKNLFSGMSPNPPMVWGVGKTPPGGNGRRGKKKKQKEVCPRHGPDKVAPLLKKTPGEPGEHLPPRKVASPHKGSNPPAPWGSPLGPTFARKLAPFGLFPKKETQFGKKGEKLPG